MHPISESPSAERHHELLKKYFLPKQFVLQKLLEEMYAPQCTAKKQISGYGLGIYKAIHHNTVRLSHGGLGYGISTHYRFLPEHKIGVVLLTNQDAVHNAPT